MASCMLSRLIRPRLGAATHKPASSWVWRKSRACRSGKLSNALRVECSIARTSASGSPRARRAGKRSWCKKTLVKYVRGVSCGARSKWKSDSTLSGHLWTPRMSVSPRASGAAANVGSGGAPQKDRRA